MCKFYVDIEFNGRKVKDKKGDENWDKKEDRQSYVHLSLRII